MDISRLPTAELKRELSTGKELAAVMKLFFDKFVDEPGFIEAGHPVPVPEQIQRAVGHAVASMSKNKIAVTEWQIAEVSLLNLIHGSVTIDGHPGVLLWATDIDTGILAMPDVKTGNVVYGRMTISNPAAARPQ